MAKARKTTSAPAQQRAPSPEADAALFLALHSGDLENTRAALEQGADPEAIDPKSGDWHPLHVAALKPGRATIVQALIAAGADPNMIARKYSPLYLAARYADVETVEAFLEAGADIDFRSSLGTSLLLVAAEAGQLDIAKYLLAKGADLNARENFGRTALHLAAGRDKSEMIAWLLKEGIDKNARDSAGKTAVHYPDEKSVVELLEKHGVSRDIVKDKESEARVAAQAKKDKDALANSMVQALKMEKRKR